MTELRRKLPRRGAAARIAVACVAAVLGGCFAAEPAHRYFQPSPDQVGPYANSFGEAVVPRHGLIVVQGDGLAYGLARRRSPHAINGAEDGQAATTISESLRRVFGGQARVENRGFPGDTVSASAARWAGQPPGNLLILCYGYGDMSAHTSPDAFRAALRTMIRAARDQGATVFVVLPPSFSDPLMANELAPYRTVAADVARHQQAESFDAGAAMARIKSPALKTPAQVAAVYAAIAGDMAPYIKIVEATVPPSPQTGQAGSADSRTVRPTAASAS